MCDSVVVDGCECCFNSHPPYVCCPEPCCEGNPRDIDWGEKCGSVEWKDESPPPRVDIYLTVHEGKPMVKIVKAEKYAEESAS